MFGAFLINIGQLHRFFYATLSTTAGDFYFLLTHFATKLGFSFYVYFVLWYL